MFAERGSRQRVVGLRAAQPESVVLVPAVSEDRVLDPLEMATARELRIFEDVLPILDRDGFDATSKPLSSPR